MNFVKIMYVPILVVPESNILFLKLIACLFVLAKYGLLGT